MDLHRVRAIRKRIEFITVSQRGSGYGVEPCSAITFNAERKDAFCKYIHLRIDCSRPRANDKIMGRFGLISRVTR
jgi:hypothetical protein